MRTVAVAGCFIVALVVIGFLTATDVINLTAAIAIFIALLLAAGLELKRQRS